MCSQISGFTRFFGLAHLFAGRYPRYPFPQDMLRATSRVQHCSQASFSTSITHVTREERDVKFLDVTLSQSFSSRFILAEESAYHNIVGSKFHMISDYLRVVQKMANLGLFPLVHGQNCGWMISQNVLAALGFKGLNQHRMWSAQRALQSFIFQQNIDQWLRQEEERKSWQLTKNTKWMKGNACHPTWMHDHLNRDHVMAVTIGVFHATNYESPLYFVFGGSRIRKVGDVPTVLDKFQGNTSVLENEKCQGISQEMISQGMLQCHYSRTTINHFLNALNPLYKKAFHLKYGQLLVIGTPLHQLPNNIYHSFPLGFPTGLRMKHVVERLSSPFPWQRVPRQGLQARLIFNDEAMGKTSPFIVVNATDPDQVERYCQGDPIKTKWINQALKAISSPTDTTDEIDTRNRYIALKKEIQDAIQKYLRDHSKEENYWYIPEKT